MGRSGGGGSGGEALNTPTTHTQIQQTSKNNHNNTKKWIGQNWIRQNWPNHQPPTSTFDQKMDWPKLDWPKSASTAPSRACRPADTSPIMTNVWARFACFATSSTGLLVLLDLLRDAISQASLNKDQVWSDEIWTWPDLIWKTKFGQT